MQQISVINRPRLKVGFQLYKDAAKVYLRAYIGKRIITAGGATYKDAVAHYWVEGS